MLAAMVLEAAKNAIKHAEALSTADQHARQIAAYLDALDVLPAAKAAETAAALSDARALVDATGANSLATMADAVRVSMLLTMAAEALTESDADALA